MKKADWKSAAELIGIAAIVASLVFVGLELQQSREIAMSDGALANGANEIERYNAISDNADIWIRGSRGDELSENEGLVFQNLVRTIQTTEFMEIARLRRVGANDIADALTADFAAFLFENPGARHVWLGDVQSAQRYRTLLAPGRELIDNTFSETVNSHLTKLDQLKE